MLNELFYWKLLFKEWIIIEWLLVVVIEYILGIIVAQGPIL